MKKPETKGELPETPTYGGEPDPHPDDDPTEAAAEGASAGGIEDD